MNRNLIFPILLLITVSLACGGVGPTPPPDPPAAAPSPTPIGVTARVLHVVDGDTIKVDIEGREYRVRYIGINTPEWDQPFGAQATQANQDLVEDKTVVLEKDVSETDKYGRLLRYVYVDGLMVNAELVRRGYAYAGSYPPDVKHQAALNRLQQEAREAHRGLWADEP